VPRAKVRAFPGLVFTANFNSPADRQAGKRQLRKGQILNALRTSMKSRVEIARELRFNLRTVSLLIDELIREGVVEEQPSRITTSGRRPVPVALRAGAACVMGIDAGRTHTQIKITDLSGSVLASVSRSSSRSRSESQHADAIEETVVGFLQENQRELPPLAGVGLAVEGVVYRRGLPEDYLGAAEPIRQQLERVLRVPVVVDSDSRFMALGEQWFGSAGGLSNVAVFNVTEGLGLACMQNGQVLYGQQGWAGEVGHVPLGDRGVKCFCGSTGCLENIASGSGIARLAQQAGLTGKVEATAAEVASLAGSGSKPALEIFDKFAGGLALAITLAMDLFNPGTIIVGGELARHSNLFLPAVEKELERLAVPRIRTSTPVLVSNLFEDAVTLGGCARVLHQIYDTAHVRVEEVL